MTKQNEVKKKKATQKAAKKLFKFFSEQLKKTENNKDVEKYFACFPDTCRDIKEAINYLAFENNEDKEDIAEIKKEIIEGLKELIFQKHGPYGNWGDDTYTETLPNCCGVDELITSGESVYNNLYGTALSPLSKKEIEEGFAYELSMHCTRFTIITLTEKEYNKNLIMSLSNFRGFTFCGTSKSNHGNYKIYILTYDPKA